MRSSANAGRLGADIRRISRTRGMLAVRGEANGV